MYDFIAYMGKQIERKRLFSKHYILHLLEEEGACFTALENVRNWYDQQFGNELYWNYPFCDGLHNGAGILPVQEGFLWLPYDEVDAETYEQYLLDDASLLTTAEAASLLKELKAYMKGLCAALDDIGTELSAIQYQDGEGAVYYLSQGMDRDKYKGFRRYPVGACRRPEGLPGLKYTDRAQAQQELDEYARKHSLRIRLDGGDDTVEEHS